MAGAFYVEDGEIGDRRLPTELTSEWSNQGPVRAKRWNRCRIQAYGSLCTYRDRRPQGVQDGILQVDTDVDSPPRVQRSKSRGV